MTLHTIETGTIRLTMPDGVAVLTLDNPPINGLSASVRTVLLKRLAAAVADDAVETLVLTGAGRMFSAWADIREVGQASIDPHLSTVLTAIEDSSELIVAAIHGVAAGGGPMYWADRVGLKPAYDTMRHLYDDHGEWLKPAPLLEQLTADDKGLGDLS